MQRFLAYTFGDTIHLQSAEIMKDAVIQILNKNGQLVFTKKIDQTNFMHINTKLRPGYYKLHIKENKKEWTKEIILDNE
jgi:flagellar hook assembly protein FlgD